jgi:hypothetical protein
MPKISIFFLINMESSYLISLKHLHMRKMKSLISRKINFMKMKPNFHINMKSSYLISVKNLHINKKTICRDGARSERGFRVRMGKDV